MDFLFVSRLSVEERHRDDVDGHGACESAVRLKVIGDGPMAPEVKAAAERNPRIQYTGRLPQREVLDLMGASRCVLFPSEWYETFGRVAAESFSRGTPVIASRIGAVAEIVDDGRTGFHYTAGDPRDLYPSDRQVFARGRFACRYAERSAPQCERKYTAELGYEMLLDIYEKAIAADPVSLSTAQPNLHRRQRPFSSPGYDRIAKRYESSQRGSGSYQDEFGQPDYQKAGY